MTEVLKTVNDFDTILITVNTVRHNAWQSMGNELNTMYRCNCNNESNYCSIAIYQSTWVSKLPS